MPVMEGQGDAVQGVRRRRRLPAVASTPSDQMAEIVAFVKAAAPTFGAIPTWRTSPRPAASRSSGACSSELDVPVLPRTIKHGTADRRSPQRCSTPCRVVQASEPRT